MTEFKIVGHEWDLMSWWTNNPVLGSTIEGHRLYVTQEIRSIIILSLLDLGVQVCVVQNSEAAGG